MVKFAPPTGADDSQFKLPDCCTSLSQSQLTCCTELCCLRPCICISQRHVNVKREKMSPSIAGIVCGRPRRRRILHYNHQTYNVSRWGKSGNVRTNFDSSAQFWFPVMSAYGLDGHKA